MKKFLITISDATEYKSEIIDFWQKYLPGTPAKRFDWMSTNPDGKPIWFLAFEKDSAKLVGTVSVLPRLMINNNKEYRAGIMGDFMIASEYRVFGPALDLQKKVVATFENYGLDFLYTLPNQSSLKLGERAGLSKMTDLNYYIKPINVEAYISRYVNTKIAKLFVPIVNTGLALISKETYLRNDGSCKVVQDVNDAFETLWEHVKETRMALTGNHSEEYLRWRYLQDPMLNFSIMTIQASDDKKLRGYIVFAMNGLSLEIFDLIASERKYIDKLLKRLINLAKEKNTKSIVIRLATKDNFYKRIKKFGFFHTESNACILARGMSNLGYQNWAYVEGDRNI